MHLETRPIISVFTHLHPLNLDSLNIHLPDSLTREYHRIVFFDTETTGVNFDSDCITELSAILFVGGKPVDYLDTYIRLPVGKKISDEAKKVCPITESELKTLGISEEEAIEEFCALAFFHGFNPRDEMQIPADSKRLRMKYADAIYDYKGTGRVLFIGHNIHFDMNMIYGVCKRLGREFNDNFDCLDTLSIFRDRHEYPHKLDAALAHYKIADACNSHLAIDDAWAVVRLLEALDLEKDDLQNYINVFGYPAKYGCPMPSQQVARVKYVVQGFNGSVKNKTLYEKA